MMTPPRDSLTTAGRMGVSGSADGHEPTSTLLCECMYLRTWWSSLWRRQTGGVDSRRGGRQGRRKIGGASLAAESNAAGLPGYLGSCCAVSSTATKGPEVDSYPRGDSL